MIFTKWFKLHYWPPLTSAWFVLTLVITFPMATIQKHVYIYFPMISDTGTTPPESCIFGQMLNIGAIFVAITAYIRYRQVEFIHNSKEVVIKNRWNTAGLWCGIFTSAGISVVANFQQTSLYSIHILGATVTFISATILMFVQTVISFSHRNFYNKYPEYGITPKILFLRIVCTVCSTILFFTGAVCLAIAFKQYTGHIHDIAWWTEKDGGHQFRIIGTFAEWLWFINFVIFLLTFTREYKLLKFEEIRFENKLKNCDSIEEKATTS